MSNSNTVPLESMQNSYELDNMYKSQIERIIPLQSLAPKGKSTDHARTGKSPEAVQQRGFPEGYSDGPLLLLSLLYPLSLPM
eukprot:5729902-Amphidinium_carterae.2